MSLAARLGLFYVALFGFIGIFMPYVPVWMRAQGLDAIDIAIVLAAPMPLRVATGLLASYLADRWGSRRRMLVLLAWFSLGAVVLYLMVTGFWPILLVTLLLTAAHPSMMPLADTLTMRAAGEGRLDYGRVRLWGSLSFIALSWVFGALLERGSPDLVILGLIVLSVLTVVAAYSLPAENRPESHAAGVSVAGAWRLARHPVFVVFVLSASLVQAGHAVYYGFGTLNWQAQGIGETAIGALWGTGVAAEIVLFAVSAPLVARLGPTGLLGLGAAAVAVRWSVMAYSPPLPLLFPLQALHALTFGAAHLAAIHFVARAAPPHLAATAQSLYAVFSGGVIMGAAMLGAGPLYQSLGADAYFAMAGLGVAALGGVLWLRARWDGGVLREE